MNPRPSPGSWFDWLPANWDPRARRWRRTRGPILNTDAFLDNLERRRRCKTKPTTPASTWADLSKPREDG